MVEILITIFLSTVKFAMTFPLAVMQFQFGFVETLVWTNVGGILGIYFFGYLSQQLLFWWRRTLRWFRPEGGTEAARDKKVFTRRNRRIVRIKSKYGLIGIALTTPFLLSIPVGTFLVVRYYRHTRTRFFYLIASNLAWSVIYTAFYLFWDGILFNRS